jgi:(5-formylfuran-3-yl)methyl phosphate synthase
MPAHVQPVPVAYADWPAAAAPSPSVAIALAAQFSGRMLLIDTHDKTRGGLLNHLCLESLAEFAEVARAEHVELALAGSLDAEAIELLMPLRPAYIGVRGAVCRGGRSGAVDFALVKSLVDLIHSSEKNVADRCLT